MAFSDKKYKKLGEVLKQYQLQYQIVNEMEVVQTIEPSEYLADYIQFILKNVAYKISEEAICENILNPILIAVWKNYAQYFSFWSHTALTYDGELKGIPDFLITKRSPLGHIILEQPYIAVVEAKLDDFVGGWAQCALEMIAMQKINGTYEKPIYGIVTNGDIWQFGKLEGHIFIEYETKITLHPLSKLISTLTYILEECKRIYIDDKN